MKKKMTIWLLSQLMGILPAMSAIVTSDPSHLEFSNIWMEGCLRADLVQRLHVTVTNTGDRDYVSYWKQYNADTHREAYDRGGFWYYQFDAAKVPAGSTCEVCIDMLFHEVGHFNVDVTGLKDNDPILFSYSVDIAEYQDPRLKADLHVDMMEQTAEGNLLYGHLPTVKVSGWVEVTNQEDFIVICLRDIAGGSGFDVGVGPYFNNWYGNLAHIADEMKPGETVRRSFSFDLPVIDPQTNQPYDGEFHVGVDFYPIRKDLADVRFKVKESMLTYWTKDGHVNPLEVSSGEVIKIPEEATAVDLRGVYEQNTIYTVDPSKANPNCLYFVNGLDYVKGMESVLWVRDYEANNLILSDGYPFYTPMPFKTKVAQYLLKPRRENGEDDPSGSASYSETLVLPFEAERVLQFDINGYGETDLTNPYLCVYHYDKNVGSSLFFKRITELPLRAYEPYLLTNLSPSRLLFFGENLELPSTRLARTHGDGADFVGSTAGMVTQPCQEAGYYFWNRDLQNFFPKDLPALEPFRCCMDLNNWIYGSSYYPTIQLFFDYEQSAAITELPATDPLASGRQTYTAVFSLSGQQVATVPVNGTHPDIRSLSPGLYIISGHKVVVK